MVKGFFEKIQRHYAVASASFGKLCEEMEIPPLNTAVTQAMAELNKDDPDIEQLEKIISASPELASKVIQTVNSSFYGLHDRVTGVMHAASVLGLNRLQQLILAYGAMDSIQIPKDSLFEQESFWTDSMIRAMVAKALAKKKFPARVDVAYTAALLADIAIPVLLTRWGDYYHSVIEEWRGSTDRLSAIERKHFGWDHAQAGAWIAKSWGLPVELICYLGGHNLEWNDLERLELSDTPILPIAVSAMIPSCMRPEEGGEGFHQAATGWLGLDNEEYLQVIREVSDSSHEMLSIFGFPESRVKDVFESLLKVAKV